MTSPVAAVIHPISTARGDADGSSRLLLTTGPAGDDDDRRRLGDALMPEIAALAARYAEASGVEEREFLAAGMRGLERALQHYVPEPRTPFGPYAMWWIRQAMETLRAGG